MTNEDNPAERLGRFVRARRRELKLTQADVQAAHGPSTATLRLIENGHHTDFRTSTSDPLERVLRWEPGSIDNILTGGDPTPFGLGHGLDVLIPTDEDDDRHPSGMLHVATIQWESVRDLAEAAFGSVSHVELQSRAVRAVAVTADVLTDLLLASSEAPASKELIAEMFTTWQQLQDRLPKRPRPRAGDDGVL